jgi:hypothetical protein
MIFQITRISFLSLIWIDIRTTELSVIQWLHNSWPLQKEVTPQKNKYTVFLQIPVLMYPYLKKTASLKIFKV